MKYKKIEERRNKRFLMKQEQAKILQNLSEEAKKAKEKELEEKFKKKREELKKKREEENIKRAKVVYGKVIKSFSMSDRSIAKYETEKAKREKKIFLMK